LEFSQRFMAAPDVTHYGNVAEQIRQKLGLSARSGE
jgi:hypothetical protein